MTIPIGKCIQFWILIFLCSCGSPSFADLRFEGEVQTKKLAEELRSIESKEELQKALPKLKKRFNKLAAVLIEARSFAKEEAPASFASEQLFVELARLYEMPGGKDLIEKAQSEAIVRLQR